VGADEVLGLHLEALSIVTGGNHLELVNLGSVTIQCWTMDSLFDESVAALEVLQGRLQEG
jgi:hypothetical protein